VSQPPSLKGQNCITTLAEVKKVLGPERYAAFVAALPPVARAHTERRIMAVEWVPIAEWTPIEDAIVSELCHGDMHAYRDFTRQVVLNEFNTVYRFFLKVPSAGFVVQKFTRIYGTYYSCGRLLLKSFEDNPTRERPTIIELEFPMGIAWLAPGLLGAYDAILSLIRAESPSAWIVEEKLLPASTFVRFAVTY
jgi:hypothetical protein